MVLLSKYLISVFIFSFTIKKILLLKKPLFALKGEG